MLYLIFYPWPLKPVVMCLNALILISVPETDRKSVCVILWKDDMLRCFLFVLGDKTNYVIVAV